MRALLPLLLLLWLSGCGRSDEKSAAVPEALQPDTVAVFTGQQPTGITVSKSGRIFVCFPRWRDSLKLSVAELSSEQLRPYPGVDTNEWREGDIPKDSSFLSVQSVFASGNDLYILDTRNPKFQGVIDAPRIFRYNLARDELSHLYILDSNSYYPDSYMNDLRIDTLRSKAYLTDSGHPGLVVLDLEEGTNFRILNEHYATSAETNKLEIDTLIWRNTVHVDGIALEPTATRLYFHALTGYSLYSVAVDSLLAGEEAALASLVFHGKTSAPDGMIFDRHGNLYFADLENDQIRFLGPRGKRGVLLEGPGVNWADTFSIHEGWLYFTNSRIHEAGEDITGMEFTLSRLPLTYPLKGMADPETP